MVLMDQTELSQLLKLHTLATHYQEHCQKNPNMGFASFLSDHYFSNQDDGDANEDNKLPFKQHNDCRDLSSNPPLSEVNTPIIISQMEIIAFYPDLDLGRISYESISGIWQPPQNS